MITKVNLKVKYFFDKSFLVIGNGISKVKHRVWSKDNHQFPGSVTARDCAYNLLDYHVFVADNKPMQYEWDENKRFTNLVRHKVDFADAVDFKWDTTLETIDNRLSYGEERWVALGFIGKELYVPVYSFRIPNADEAQPKR